MTKKVKLYVRIWALILVCAMMLSSCSTLQELLEFDIEDENAAPSGDHTAESDTNQYAPPASKNDKITENIIANTPAGESGEISFVFADVAGVSGEFTVDDGVTVNNIVVKDARGKKCDEHNGKGEIRIIAFNASAKLTSYTVTVNYTLDETATASRKIVFIGETSDVTGRVLTPRQVNIKINIADAVCTHKDVEPSDHSCDMCGEKLSECADYNNDHSCDVCGAKLSECVDADNDHKCDSCGVKTSECVDADNDHICDACGNKISNCTDNDNDHNCDMCGNGNSECTDNNNDHNCDLCGNKLTECADNNNDHNCDLCGAKLSECADNNSNHCCDLCGIRLTECSDSNGDRYCDIYGEFLYSRGLDYFVNIDNTCTITGIGTCTDTDIFIPKYIDGHKVTGIENLAFYKCSSLTSIVIPDCVTSIGRGAFNGCTLLTSVNIPDGITSIGRSTFYSCRSLENITIPGSVTDIGRSAFSECYLLKSINFNGTLEEWNNISKGNYWDRDAGYNTIYCTDGEITK